MKITKNAFTNQAKRVVAILLIGSVYISARLPHLSESERQSLASHFNFSRSSLPELQGFPQRTLRTVHPSLKPIESWISTTGASVALNDIDGDGLPNDVVYVDTRIDQVVVAQVPGTPPRYEPFTLPLTALPYEPETMAPMGCLPCDLNEDGLIDIVVYFWGRTPVVFLRRPSVNAALPASLTASQYTASELMPGEARWNTNAATQADLDGDGHLDLIFGNYFPDGARVLDATGKDKEYMQASMSRANNGGQKHFLLWSDVQRPQQSGEAAIPHFTEADAGLSEDAAYGWTLAVGAADLDGDMLPEIYFANDFGPDLLIHNLSTPGHLRFERLRGEKTFTTPNSKVLGRDSFKGMGVDFGDLNGDGWLDIYVSNIAAEYALEESHFVWVSTGQIGRMADGIAPFVDRSEGLGLSRSGWGWDTRFGDFDNDGILEALQATGFLKGEVNRWPELHELAMGNDQMVPNPIHWPQFHPGDDLAGQGHNPFFVRATDGRYYDLSREIQIDDPQISRGIATADVDGDGRLDFAIANQWDTSYFYHNLSPTAGAFLGLHLLLPCGPADLQTTIDPPRPPGGAPLGSPAVGAAATLYLPDGRKLVSQVDGGNGHSGKRDPSLHFGLGEVASNTPLRVELAWRNRQGNVIKNTFWLHPGWHTVLLGQ